MSFRPFAVRRRRRDEWSAACRRAGSNATHCVAGRAEQPALSGSGPASPGLSPRVRGSRQCALFDVVRVGSIPACAGEPQELALHEQTGRVYPRVCGGAHRYSVVLVLGSGLSPRVRGSRSMPPLALGCLRSIPACAGEPSRVEREGADLWVYPRVCGGAWLRMHGKPVDQGLSPRVRGSRDGQVLYVLSGGSIPACAGEPKTGRCRHPGDPVYPRVCGGAVLQRAFEANAHGLSPRVRGSQCPRLDLLVDQGSIPACAGEPVGAFKPGRGRWVYPRVCGGASISWMVGTG